MNLDSQRSGSKRSGWLSTLRSRSFYLSYLMVALPVLVISNLLFYLLFVPMYQQEVTQINAETVKGIQMAFDRYVVAPLDQTYLGLVVRDTTIDITYPLNEPKREDTWKLYQAHQHMKSLVEDSNGLLNRLDVYYHTSDFINGSGGYLSASNRENLLSPGWLDFLDMSSEHQWHYNKEEKRFSVISPTTQEVVYYFRSFPAGTNPAKRKMTVVFTMPRDYLEDILVNQIGFEEYQITLLSSNGDVLINTGNEPPPENLQLLLEDAAHEGKTFHVGQQMVTVLSSARSDLHFVFSIPKAHYFRRTDQIKWQLLILASLAMLLVLILSRIISRKMYSPIAVINQTASDALTAMGMTSSNDGDSYATIHEALDVLSSRVQDLDSRLAAYRPRLRTNLYRDLLFSGRLGQLAIEERMEALGIHPSPNYRVLMLHFSDEIREPALTDLLKMKMIEFIRSYDANGFTTFVTLHEEDNIIAVFSYAEESTMQQLLDDMSSQLWTGEHPATSVRAAVGRCQDDILGVRTSMREAQKAIRYGFLFPQRILRYEVFSSWEKTESTLSCADADTLFSLVNDLSSPQAATASESFVQELRKQIYAQPFSYQYLHFVLLDILMSCVETISKRGIFIDKLYERDIFDRYERASTYDEYEATLRCILEELTERIQLKRGNANYDTVTMVQRYVQDHLQEQLSLKLVSEHFHISYSHMSKVFKEISGMNFTEYVLQCRLEASIPLLLETTMNLETIAEKIGIFNAGYYIRTFKARYGVTPKQYRLAHV